MIGVGGCCLEQLLTERCDGAKKRASLIGQSVIANFEIQALPPTHSIYNHVNLPATQQTRRPLYAAPSVQPLLVWRTQFPRNAGLQPLQQEVRSQLHQAESGRWKPCQLRQLLAARLWVAPYRVNATA
jgi:hypothetical protein